MFLSYVGDLSNEEPDTRMRRFSFGEIMAVAGIIAGSVTLGQVIGKAKSSIKMLATSGTRLSFNHSLWLTLFLVRGGGWAHSDFFQAANG